MGRDQTVRAPSVPLARSVDLAARNLRPRILCQWPIPFHPIYSASALDQVIQKKMQRQAVKFQKESLGLHLKSRELQTRRKCQKRYKRKNEISSA